MSISTTLRRATLLHAKIEKLRGQLTQLLDQARAEVAAIATDELPILLPRRGRPRMFKSNGHHRGKAGREKISKVGARNGRKRSPLLGVKRAASPSGPLAPAVVAVLRAKRKPMKVGDILNGLLAKGYQFNSAEPRKNLAARIYRLKGVKQVSAGLFATS